MHTQIPSCKAESLHGWGHPGFEQLFLHLWLFPILQQWAIDWSWFNNGLEQNWLQTRELL